jgi:prepilin-type N-terminal cleavage/methylation domain-containing protein
MKTSQRGFTLIEITIGLAVLGLLMLPLIHFYNLHQIQERIRQSDGHLITIQSALQKFAIRNGRYPLPSAYGLGPGVANYGQEYGGGIPACAPGMTNICRTTGFRDLLPPAGNDPVLIGAVPFAALGLPQKISIDGYGRKITYAVSETMTVAATFQDDRGVIKIVDRSGGNTSGTNNNAHYAVISHGKDGKGAFTQDGVLVQPCTPAGQDLENCDNDGSFNNNFDFLPEYVRYAVDPPGAQHFDDYTRYSITTTGDTWTKTANAPDIYNRNTGNVRIGPGGAPAAKVEVMGNIKSDSLHTTRLCLYGGCDTPGSTVGLAAPAYPPKVFRPEILGGIPNAANAAKSGGGISCGDRP